jgi:glutamate synthase (ferredoxin)
MTGGRAVVLGKTGKNFAAGMSGGIAYVLDEDRDLYMKINKELVSLSVVEEKYDIKELRDIIEEHVKVTNSAKGKEILEHFEDYIPKFKKILPHDFARIHANIVKFEEKGMSNEQAQIEAFYATKAQ